MLEAYIIDQIRKQQEREQEDRRPSLQLPVGPPPGWLEREEEREEERRRQEQDSGEADRGVIIIQL